MDPHPPNLPGMHSQGHWKFTFTHQAEMLGVLSRQSEQPKRTDLQIPTLTLNPAMQADPCSVRLTVNKPTPTQRSQTALWAPDKWTSNLVLSNTGGKPFAGKQEINSGEKRK